MKDGNDFPKYPPVLFVRGTEKLRNFLLRLYRRFTHPDVAVFEMVHQFWLVAAMGVAAELGIADILRQGKKDIRELAGITTTHEESLYRLLRVLASNDIFREDKDRCFSLTPLAEALQEDRARYLVTAHLTRIHYQMFSELMYCVKTGKNAAELITGTELFESIGSSMESSELFNRAMTTATRMQVPAILSAFSFGRFWNIIDVGGGEGLLLAAILQKYPRIRGVVFDLPQSTVRTAEVFDRYNVAGRATIETGSFFESVPCGGDLYMLKSVLHNWDDEPALKILSNIRKVMESGARLLIIDSILGGRNEPSFGKMTDILMLVAMNGKERTLVEFESLLDQSGFTIQKIHPTVTPHKLIEAKTK